MSLDERVRLDRSDHVETAAAQPFGELSKALLIKPVAYDLQRHWRRAAGYRASRLGVSILIC